MSLLISKDELRKLTEDKYLWSEYYQRFIFPEDGHRFTLLDSVAPDGTSVAEVMKRIRCRVKDEPDYEEEIETVTEAEAANFTPQLVERLIEALDAKQQQVPAEPVQVNVTVPPEAIKVEASLDVAFEETDIIERDADGFISKIVRSFRRIRSDQSTPIGGPTPENPSPSLRKFVREQFGI